MLCPDCGADAPMAGARLTPDGPEYLYNCPNGHPVCRGLPLPATRDRRARRDDPRGCPVASPAA
jgi:hypothetical protein